MVRADLPPLLISLVEAARLIASDREVAAVLMLADLPYRFRAVEDLLAR